MGEVRAEGGHAGAAAKIHHFFAGRLDVESAERADGGDFVARFEAVEVGGAGSGTAIQAARGRADADVESQLLIHAGVGGQGEVAADGQRVFGAEVENVLRLPDLGKGGIHGDFVERYFVVGGDVELQVVARLVIEQRRARLGFKNEFLDERGDVVVADDAESVGAWRAARGRNRRRN